MIDQNPEQKKVRKGTRAIYIGSFIALLIAISPYIFYTYEGFPTTKTLETPFFTLTSKFNENIRIFAWVFLGKFVPLYLLIIWFFTCRHWWYHVILIPISMYIFQLSSAINADVQYIDEFEIYYIIPIMMIVIPIVYLIRLKIFDKVVHGIDLKQIEDELKKYEEKEKHQDSTSHLDE